MKKTGAVLALLGVLLACGPALAAFSNVSTLVTFQSNLGETAPPPPGDWMLDNTTVHLFEPPSYYNPSGPPLETWGQNNMSPVDYGGVSPAYVPSPGNYLDYDAGEHFDLEGLFYRLTPNGAAGQRLEVWLITSLGPDGFAFAGNYYHLGDVFVNVDDDAAFEYALLGFGTLPGLGPTYHTVWGYSGNTWSGTNREAGGVATLGTGEFLYEINGPNSYQGRAEEVYVNPWAVSAPGTVTGGTLEWQQVTTASSGENINDWDFEGGPSGYPPSGTHSTFVYKWDVLLPVSGKEWYDLAFHVTVQCGNDLIKQAWGVDQYGNVQPPIPAPGALVLAGMGVGGVALARTIRRRRRG